MIRALCWVALTILLLASVAFGYMLGGTFAEPLPYLPPPTNATPVRFVAPDPTPTMRPFVRTQPRATYQVVRVSCLFDRLWLRPYCPESGDDADYYGPGGH